MIARVLAVPNPLLDLKLSWTELPNSLVETGLWVGVGRGGEEKGAVGSRLHYGSEAAPCLRSSIWLIRSTVSLWLCIKNLQSERQVWLHTQIKLCLNWWEDFHLPFVILVGNFLVRSKSSAKALGRNYTGKEWYCLSGDFWMVFWVFRWESCDWAVIMWTSGGDQAPWKDQCPDSVVRGQSPSSNQVCYLAWVSSRPQALLTQVKCGVDPLS